MLPRRRGFASGRCHGPQQPGWRLKDKGKVDEAIDCYRMAIALDPKLGVAHGGLGEALLWQGEFSQAQKSLRRCLTLLPPNHPVRDYTLNLVQQCQQLLAADGKLQAFLAGKGAPVDTATQVQMADLAHQPYRRLYHAAARLYRDAFAGQPALASAHRYNAACATALAGTGQGKDAVGLDDAPACRVAATGPRLARRGAGCLHDPGEESRRPPDRPEAAGPLAQGYRPRRRPRRAGAGQAAREGTRGVAQAVGRCGCFAQAGAAKEVGKLQHRSGRGGFGYSADPCATAVSAV